MQVSKAFMLVIWMGNKKVKAFWRVFKFSKLFPGACEVTVLLIQQILIEHPLCAGTILATSDTAVSKRDNAPSTAEVLSPG